MSTVTFARGAAPKAAKAGKAGVVQAAVNAVAGTGGTGVYNGMVGTKRGFQPGNQYGKRHGGGASKAQLASGKHRSARAVVSKHIKAGTLSTPEGRAAVRTAAAAHRELQAARTEAKANRSADAKAKRALARGPDKASPLPKPGEPRPTPTPAPAPAAPTPVAKRVEKSAKEASSAKADRAHQHLADLHAKADAGELKAVEVHQHVERIARGATKDELFAAAKKAGVEHNATTKKALVEHLKGHAQLRNQDASVAKAPLPLKDFAAKVTAASQATPAGKFGDDKTLINHAKAAAAASDPRIGRMTDAEFKTKLVEAHNAGLLELGRGDLFDTLRPADVKASDTPHLNANYHFVRHAPATKKGAKS